MDVGLRIWDLGFGIVAVNSSPPRPADCPPDA